MKKINEPMKSNIVSTELDIDGSKYSLLFEEGDSYLGSKEANLVRSAETRAFKKICIQLLKDLDVENTSCLDVGANIGLTSLALGQIAYNRDVRASISKILSFEPEPVTYQCMEQNVKIFSDLIVPLNYAVGARSEVLSFTKTPGSTSASHIDMDAHISGESHDVVNVERLDYFVEKLVLPHVGLIKVDVEGYEKSVLQGATETIEKFNPWIYMEFNSWTLMAFGGLNPKEYLEYLMDTYQIVCKVDTLTGSLEPIKSKNESLAFLYMNIVKNNCLDDLVLRWR